MLHTVTTQSKNSRKCSDFSTFKPQYFLKQQSLKDSTTVKDQSRYSNCHFLTLTSTENFAAFLLHCKVTEQLFPLKLTMLWSPWLTSCFASTLVNSQQTVFKVTSSILMLSYTVYLICCILLYVAMLLYKLLFKIIVCRLCIFVRTNLMYSRPE